jgi:hypothetical protein
VSQLSVVTLLLLSVTTLPADDGPHGDMMGQGLHFGSGIVEVAQATVIKGNVEVVYGYRYAGEDNGGFGASSGAVDDSETFADASGAVCIPS